MAGAGLDIHIRVERTIGRYADEVFRQVNDGSDKRRAMAFSVSSHFRTAGLIMIAPWTLEGVRYGHSSSASVQDVVVGHWNKDYYPQVLCVRSDLLRR